LRRTLGREIEGGVGVGRVPKAPPKGGGWGVGMRADEDDEGGLVGSINF